MLEHKEYIAAFSVDGGVTLSRIVVELLRDAITLREKASEMIEKGITLNINISNSFNYRSEVNNGNFHCDSNKGVIYINDPKILIAAQVTRSPVNALLSQIDGKLVEYIDINNNDESYRLTPDQQRIIGRQKEELPTTLNIVGRLDMVAFSSHRGIIISDSERFPVTWDENIRAKVQQVADVEGVVFKVRPVIDRKRLDDEAIGFHVLDCGCSQRNLDL